MPLRFENFLAKVGPLSWVEEVSKTDDRCVGGSNLDKVASADLDHGVPSCLNSFSIEEVPQTPIFESEFLFLWEGIEDIVPNNEDLVEVKISWDVGKTLGLQVSDEGAMIAALAKVQEI